MKSSSKKKGFKLLLMVLCAVAILLGACSFPQIVRAEQGYQNNVAPPTVHAEIVGSLLRIEATDGFYPIEAVFINSRRFNFRVDSAILIDISNYITTGDSIAVHAVDFAGNASNTVLLTPPPPMQPPQPNNLTPEGQAQVIDYATNEDAIEFLTINTPTGNTFFLVIDHTRANNNVYFLNAVTEWDLMTLANDAELPAPPLFAPTPPPPPIEPQETIPQPEPTPEPSERNSGNSNTGMIIFMLIAGVGAFAAAYYFKIVKPKQEKKMQSETDSDDYNDDNDDDDNDDDDSDEENENDSNEDDEGDDEIDLVPLQEDEENSDSAPDEDIPLEKNSASDDEDTPLKDNPATNDEDATTDEKTEKTEE
jgi:hypothetical protein